MGEARRRGTFDERREAAISRNEKVISKYGLGKDGSLTRKQTSYLGMMFGALGVEGVDRVFGGGK